MVIGDSDRSECLVNLRFYIPCAQWYDLPTPPTRALGARGGNLSQRLIVMAWTTPVFEEVVLCCEINSYVSAKL